MNPRKARWIAAAMLLLLGAARRPLESSMSLHMLVQIPLLVACGAMLASGVTGRARLALDRCNLHGITGLFAFALATALVMIPRLLDLAVANLAIDAAKAAVLLACGVLLRLSWNRAGLLVQAFFLGNVLPMTAAVGQVYQDSPLRLCNSYLLSDQVRVGQALVWIAVAVAVGWLGRAGVLLVRREGRLQAP
jgi:hypothetical protein